MAGRMMITDCAEIVYPSISKRRYSEIGRGRACVEECSAGEDQYEGRDLSYGDFFRGTG